MRPPRETIQPRSALAKAMAGLTSRARGAAAGGAFVRARARGAGADREACCFARSSKSSSSSSSDEDEDDTSAAEAGAGAGAGAGTDAFLPFFLDFFVVPGLCSSASSDARRSAAAWSAAAWRAAVSSAAPSPAPPPPVPPPRAARRFAMRFWTPIAASAKASSATTTQSSPSFMSVLSSFSAVLWPFLPHFARWPCSLSAIATGTNKALLNSGESFRIIDCDR
mmetsp:Transcript_19485/g.57989  ORF Transcript_19485/g.57989 Transcript_19485/m.57989 type:complete len:224 (+) Transcript_19485:906-1577(+)